MARSPNDPIGSLLDVLTPTEKAQIPWINMPPGYGPQGGIPTQRVAELDPSQQPPSGDPMGPTPIAAGPSRAMQIDPAAMPFHARGPGTMAPRDPLWQHEVPGTERITAPMIRNPASPLFDYSPSVMQRRPDVPQFDLPRYQPPQGAPESALRITQDPANVRRLNRIAEQGARIGGLDWYNMQQLHERFIEELGHNYGTVQFIKYLDTLGATSPRRKVPENVRNASYYYKALLTGEPTPETYLKGGYWRIKKETQAPYPYGMMPIHVQNIENIKAGGLPMLQNPKPPSFTQNLAGNWQPVTIDVHNLRLLSGGRSKDDAPKATEYGHLERFQQEQARKLGMDPAQYQASLWLGGAGETGVKSGTDPMLKHFERRVEHTAEQRGQTKEQVLKDFIHGRAPLLMIPDIIPQAIKYFRGEMNAQ